MFCIMGRGECSGCMECQEPKLAMRAESGEPIYEGEEYYDFDGLIVTVDELDKYKKVAEV